MIRRAALPVLLALIGTPYPPNASAEDSVLCTRYIDSVPAKISTQGVYCLRRHLATNQRAGAAISVEADNVVIDCNGHRLDGLAAGPGTTAFGIATSGKQDNISVRNCAIRGFYHGIEFSGGSGYLVEDNRFDQNTVVGVSISGERGLIRNNTVQDTGGGSSYANAAAITTSGNVDIRGNIVDGVFWAYHVRGIRVGNSSATVSDNTVRGLAPFAANATQGNSAVGIETINSRSFLDRNSVRLSSVVDGSVGYQCSGAELPGGAMRDNSAWGFATPHVGCHDSGGNALLH